MIAASQQIVLEPHQLAAVTTGSQRLRKYRIVYLRFWMRKGKTLTSLSICNECLSGTNDAHVLFVSKNNALSSINDDYAALGKSTQLNFNLTVKNYQSLHQVKGIKFNIIVIDEAHSISGYPKPGKWAEQLKDICQNRAVIYLSATETPESFSQYYHQFWISSFSPFAKWPNFYMWAKDFVDKQETSFRGLPGSDYSKADIGKIKAHIDHLFITVRPEEGTQIKELVHHVIEVKMSEKAVMIYREIEKEKIYMNEKGEAAIANSGAELDSKLNQIASGTLKFDETIEGALPDRIGDIIDTSKADYIKSYFNGKKIAILFYYKAEGEMLRAVFPDNTTDSAVFNQRDDITYINQIQSSMEGVNLSCADCIVIFNFNESAVAFIQAPARIQSMYRDAVPDVYWVVSKHGQEREMLNNIRMKKNEYTDIHYAQKA